MCKRSILRLGFFSIILVAAGEKAQLEVKGVNGFS